MMNQNEKLSYLKELFLKTGNLYTWHFKDMAVLCWEILMRNLSTHFLSGVL